MKRLLIAVLMVTFMAMPAYAAVQNVKVSGSVDSTWLIRSDLDLTADASRNLGVLPVGSSAAPEFYQNLLITLGRSDLTSLSPVNSHEAM